MDLDIARKTLAAEGKAISDLVSRVGDSFAAAAQAVFDCQGQVVLTGVGKAGIIAQKISATLASTGTPSIYLHPVEALHGDLGRLQRKDVVIALSHSGASEEIVRLLDHIKARGSVLIALTGSAESPLARYAQTVLDYGRIEEACPHGLAPTVSTTCMLAVGDALALTVMTMRDFKPEDFAVFHPGGSLGRKLIKVEEVMSSRKGQALPLVSETLTVGQAMAEAECIPRRTGAMLIVDDAGRLTGILTDADIRRALVQAGARLLEAPIAGVMKRGPKHIHLGELASEALAILNRYRIDELPVVDAEDRPVGIVDVQDLVGMKTVDNDGD
ncbi:MAG: KpsF/GutQ family sugar-phosphate isomerase [Planctomycetota bacterium]|nr:KpsF/GutQ family sugar-phosphate isomerase [Planctomycetota bacterium]